MSTISGACFAIDPILLRLVSDIPPLCAEHAFYLGYELAKAHTALTLGKRYVQDQALSWGWLTVEETSAVHRRRVGEGQ